MADKPRKGAPAPPNAASPTAAGIETQSFLAFLSRTNSKGGLTTDDILAAMVPLVEQTLSIHEKNFVAPLKGLEAIHVVRGRLCFEFSKAQMESDARHLLEEIQDSQGQAFEVVTAKDQSREAGAKGKKTEINLFVIEPEDEIRVPVFCTKYHSWEHLLGHHDPLTDIYSLGMLMASLALGLNFNHREQLTRFVENRENLFAIRPELHRSLAKMIVRMTEPNRHKRIQDLISVHTFLLNYREQPRDEVDFSGLMRDQSITGRDKRSRVLEHLRDTLFDTSKRNPLIHFKPGKKFMNLTDGSVPFVLDYQNIAEDRLLIWQPRVSNVLRKGVPLNLGSFLCLDDPSRTYLVKDLDDIRKDAGHDVREFGFAQLRLVLVFLRWHNLKEAREVRIHSPLLLLPVELNKKKGVGDSYLLSPTGTRAEINPALSHYLKELYDLNLPESIDLAEQDLDEFFNWMQAAIEHSEPGIVLKKIDRPQIDLVYERVQRRLDNIRKTQGKPSAPAEAVNTIRYSYKRDDYRPLGLQLFLDKVQPNAEPFDPEAQWETMSLPLPRILETSRSDLNARVTDSSAPRKAVYNLRTGSDENPYLWDFDLCAFTLGNFNYRKMTLVQDYNDLLQRPRENPVFDELFAVEPANADETAPEVPLEDQYLIVPSDPTQVSAIGRARTGRNLIIQGPPGTGKSQTITNLIADYVARGKRVLFVCEKRAALDVVYHRLGQSGLDKLACLIHDSQTDKKAFVEDLKDTYEFFQGAGSKEDPEHRAELLVKRMEAELNQLGDFSKAVHGLDERSHLTVRDLLDRLIELRKIAHFDFSEVPPDFYDRLPPYADWLAHSEKIRELAEALSQAGLGEVMADCPISAVAKEVFADPNPARSLREQLDKTRAPVQRLMELVHGSVLFNLHSASLDKLIWLSKMAGCAEYLVAHNLTILLDERSTEFQHMRVFLDRIELENLRLQKAQKRTEHWTHKLPLQETRRALARAQKFETSRFAIFNPLYWRLRRVLNKGYDFSAHAIPPEWTEILTWLVDENEVQAGIEEIDKEIGQAFGVKDGSHLRGLMQTLNQAKSSDTHAELAHEFIKMVFEHPLAKEALQNLLGLVPYLEHHERLGGFIRDYTRYTAAQVHEIHAYLTQHVHLVPKLAPALSRLAQAPGELFEAVCRTRLDLTTLEAAILQKALTTHYSATPHLERFDGAAMRMSIRRIQDAYKRWLKENGPRIIERTHAVYREAYDLTKKSDTLLNTKQKLFKGEFKDGLRVLRNEFRKTKQYLPIRKLASGECGQVTMRLKPIWLMSPLSISDALPLNENSFDVVIFDEASQIKLEEAIPSAYRASQIIVVGDQMQLPPTNFFAGGGGTGGEKSVDYEEEGEMIAYDLSADSFLSHADRTLPSTLLGWHYRSRREALISFSNNAFYHGELLTIPDRNAQLAGEREILVDANSDGDTQITQALARGISFHFVKDGVYENRCNQGEAEYIAKLVRSLLARDTGLSIGIVAFSEAQQSAIAGALTALGNEDHDFASRLAEDMEREENGQFVGLFIKNLENVQGDERDIIILSICYAADYEGKMRMNFGPINQGGGEKRLNVIFSRSKEHMMVVSSIHHHAITNDYNDGANCLKGFLEYAEAISRGDFQTANRVLGGLNPSPEVAEVKHRPVELTAQAIAEGLRLRGYEVEAGTGQSKFKCDLSVRRPTSAEFELAILVDGRDHYVVGNLLERYVQRPGILRSFGWRVYEVLAKDWYHRPIEILDEIEAILENRGEEAAVSSPEISETEYMRSLELEFGLDRRSRQVKAAIETEAVIPEDENPTPALPGFGTDLFGNELEEEEESAEDEAAFLKTFVHPLPARDLSSARSTQAWITRYFERIDEHGADFWQITLDGKELEIRTGRISFPGKAHRIDWREPEKAQQEAEKLIRSKLRAGWIEADQPPLL